jgi:hypothetical protein
MELKLNVSTNKFVMRLTDYNPNSKLTCKYTRRNMTL